MSKTIKMFVTDKRPRYTDFQLNLSAGIIHENGEIDRQQRGAEETFSIGMPVYSESGEELGRLSIGLFENLNYSQEHFKGDIPVEYWRVDGYKGERQKIKTYWQVKNGL